MSTTGRHLIRYAGLALLVFVGLSLAGCYTSHPQSTFDASGPVARSQLTLFYIIFWASAFVFVTVVGVLLYALFRYRRRPGDGDPPQIHGHKQLEIVWTILPGVILAVVAVPTIFTIFDNANSPLPPEKGGMQVGVTARQWFWEFRYEDPNDPSRTVVTANELHIPEDEVVNLTLDSKDVLHSFWIPKLAGKVDMVPNRRNTIWIKADKAGEEIVYLGQCAEFCGVAHALMRFRVIAEPRPQFDAWLLAQAAPAVVPVDPLALEGKALFEGQAQCFACHTVAGSSRSRGTRGPNLSHFASRQRIAADILENTQENLRRWLTDPEKVKPGNRMAREALVFTDPERRLTESQISALVAYLRTLE